MNRSRATKGIAAFLEVCVLDFDDQIGVAVVVVVERGRRRWPGGRRGETGWSPSSSSRRSLASITSSRPSSVVKATSVLPSPSKSPATIALGPAFPAASPLPAAETHRRGERAVAAAGVDGHGIGIGAGRGQEHGDVEVAVPVAGEIADGDALGLVAGRDRVAVAGGEAARAVVQLDFQGRRGDDGQVGLAVAVEIAGDGARGGIRSGRRSPRSRPPRCSP